MKPRIFISSTFYDMKYIREELSNYVKAHDFEPIMFEDGDIGYTPGKKIDDACYDAMRSADMVILIIGGEYGSAATNENEKEFEEYISVTRKEFRTAIDNGIPVFCMIDSSVSTEYGVYDINYKDIEEKKCNIRFKATKNINVFRFIKEIKTIGNIPIQEFKKAAEIKEFLGKQWADMFKTYLNFLKSDIANKKIENSVKEMRELIQKMDIMLSTVGKNILSKDNPEEYENVINQQDILSFSREIVEAFDMIILDYDIIKDKERKVQVIRDFLLRLKKTFEEDKWGLFESDDDASVDAFFDLFETEMYTIDCITTDFTEKVKNKYKLLYDEENLKKIADSICLEENFEKLIEV